MTKHKKIILTLALTLVLSAVFVCGVCVGADASGTSQQIAATLEPGITVTFDGAAQSFFDANGNRVYPIAYKGSTYLPLRAVCQDLAGYKVDWDQATRTASIISRPADGVDLLDMQKAYYLSSLAEHHMSSENKTKEVNGYTLTHWLFLPFWAHKGEYALGSFNIEGKYDTVTFRYYSDHSATLEVIGDNESVLWTKDLNAGELYQEVTVDLLKTNQLTFKLSKGFNGDATHGYIYDVRLK